MSLLLKIVRIIVFRYLPRVRCSWYRARTLCGSWISRGTLSFVGSVQCHVPIRCDGAGLVILEEGVSLGFRGAPRLGSGEILIQARGADSRIRIGAGTATSNNVSIVANSEIQIGRKCLIGDMVIIMDSDFHELSPAKRHDGSGGSAAVVIHDNVWLGSRVQVLKGVSIGTGSVIAAGSVVTRNIPANVIAAGIPARVIREVS